MSVKRTVTIGDDVTIGQLRSIPMIDWISMPVLATGQEADLRYDGPRFRVWTGRSKLADWYGDAQGYTDSRLQFEELVDGRWVTVDGRWVTLDRYGARKT